MSIRSKICGRGAFTFELVGPDGVVKQRGEHPNLVTNAGLDHLASYYFLGLNPTDQPDAMAYIAIGTNNTAASAADTALGTELTRQLIDSVTVGGTGVISVSTTFAAGVGTGAIVECGILDAAALGTLFDRSVFAVYNKGALDTLRIAYSVTFTSA